MSAEIKGTILIVEDEPAYAMVLEKRLSLEGYRCVTAGDGLEGLRKARATMPDLILLDMMLPSLDGREVKRKLNEEDYTAAIPVIFLTSQSATKDKVEGLGLGAVDYVSKPFDFPELLARLEAAIGRRRNYEKAASTDPFTGLQNQLFFRRQLHFSFEIARRYKRPFALTVLDVDDLKAMNDSYGHAAGDRVIRSVADVMRKVFRQADLLIRYGGDEFVVLFPETDLEKAEAALERFRKAVSAEEVELPEKGFSLRYAVSAGTVAYQEHFRSPEEIFEEADQRMYRQKHLKKVRPSLEK